MSDDLPRTADAVVVGGGTVGAWCAYFLRAAGLSRVAVPERRGRCPDGSVDGLLDDNDLAMMTA